MEIKFRPILTLASGKDIGRGVYNYIGRGVLFLTVFQKHKAAVTIKKKRMT